MEDVIVQQLTLTTGKILQLVGAFIIPFVIIPIMTKVRKKIWIFAKFDTETNRKVINQLKKIAQFMNDKWGIIVLLEILLMFIYVSVILTLILGTNYLMQSMVFGAAVIIFLTFQLPKLLKPNVHITLLPCDKDGNITDIGELKEPMNEIGLSKNSKHHIFIHITNLGINNYDKCGSWLTFDKSISIIKHPELEQEYDRLGWFVQKWPYYQAENNCLVFEHTESLNFGPGDVLIRSAYIKSPDISGKYFLDIEVTSSTRWGSTVKRLYLEVT